MNRAFGLGSSTTESQVNALKEEERRKGGKEQTWKEKEDKTQQKEDIVGSGN